MFSSTIRSSILFSEGRIDLINSQRNRIYLFVHSFTNISLLCSGDFVLQFSFQGGKSFFRKVRYFLSEIFYCLYVDRHGRNPLFLEKLLEDLIFLRGKTGFPLVFCFGASIAIFVCVFVSSGIETPFYIFQRNNICIMFKVWKKSIKSYNSIKTVEEINSFLEIIRVYDDEILINEEIT